MVKVNKKYFLRQKQEIFVDFMDRISYNANVILYSEALYMKKFLAVFMAVLMIFSVCSVAVSAEETTGSGTDIEIEISGSDKEEKTTRNIQNDEGLVVPINFTQLKFSVIFKLIERVIMFILHLFAGDNASDVDESIATEISSIAEDISQAIEEGSQFIEDNTAA